MVGGGPSEQVKLKNVEKDSSFNISDTWGVLVQNIVLVCLVAATTWVLVTGVRYSITFGTDILFSPFYNLHSEESVEKDTAKAKSSLMIQKEAKSNTESSIDKFSFSTYSNKLTQTIEEYEKRNESLTNAAYIILIVLILSALIRGLLLQIPSWQSSEGDGLAPSLEYYHETYNIDETENQPRYQKPTFIQSLRRAVLTSLTVGCGGSGGIEAPVVPMGECIGAGWSKVLGVTRSDNLRIYQLSGIAAAVTTLLDAPFASALFAAEIVYNAKILYRPLMYSLIAAIVAFALNNHFLHFAPLFVPKAHSVAYTLQEYIEVSAVALICSAPATLGITFLFKKLKSMIKPFPGVARPIIGALGTGIIGLGIWFGFGLEPQHVLGVSEDTIIQVMTGEGNPLLQVWWILVLLVICKAFATGFTLMAGGSAGSLVPAMYLGGISGAAIFHIISLLGYDISAHVDVFVVAGLASALVAVVQVPLAAIAFVLEVFGANYGPPAILACVLTYLLARRWKLYATGDQA